MFLIASVQQTTRFLDSMLLLLTQANAVWNVVSASLISVSYVSRVSDWNFDSVLNKSTFFGWFFFSVINFQMVLIHGISTNRWRSLFWVRFFFQNRFCLSFRLMIKNRRIADTEKNVLWNIFTTMKKNYPISKTFFDLTATTVRCSKKILQAIDRFNLQTILWRSIPILWSTK